MRKFFYFALLSVSTSLMMLYDYQGFRFLFLCLVATPVVCLVCLLPTALFCSVRLVPGVSGITRGEKGRVRVAAANKGRFPVVGIRLCVSMTLPGEKKKKKKLRFNGIPGKNTGERAIEFTACHCGQAFFRIEGAWVSDYLGLFSIPIARGREQVFFVMPMFSELPAELLTGIDSGQTRGEREADGDYLVREYQPGDSLNRIHWKLSIKTDGLQVRDFERPGSMTLFLNPPLTAREDAQLWDSYLDRAFSLMLALVKAEIAYELLWSREDMVYRQEITDDESVISCIRCLLGGDAGKEEMLYTGNREWLSEGLHLDGDGKLYFGERGVFA